MIRSNLPTIFSILISAIISIGVYLYQEFNAHPELVLRTEKIEKLVQVREEIKDLEILYKKLPITKDSYQIKTITLTIRNDGKTLREMDDYSQLVDFKIGFQGGQLIGAKAIDGNEKWLVNNILCASNDFTLNVENFSKKISNNQEDYLCLNKLLFDRKKYVVIKTYLLQDSDKPITVKLKGKIVGTDENLFKHEIAQPQQIIKKQSQWKLVKFFVLAYLALTLLLFPYVFIQYHREKRRRKKYLNKIDIQINDSLKPIYNSFIDYGLDITNKQLFREFFDNKKDIVPLRSIINHTMNDEINYMLRTLNNSSVDYKNDFSRWYNINSKYFTIDNDNIKIRDEYYIELKEFWNSIKGYDDKFHKSFASLYYNLFSRFF